MIHNHDHELEICGAHTKMPGARGWETLSCPGAGPDRADRIPVLPGPGDQAGWPEAAPIPVAMLLLIILTIPIKHRGCLVVVPVRLASLVSTSWTALEAYQSDSLRSSKRPAVLEVYSDLTWFTVV